MEYWRDGVLDEPKFHHSNTPSLQHSITPILRRSTTYRSALLKILILKPSSLGDIVQALPVLRLLRRHLPSSEIYWWVESSFAPLLEGDSDLAGVVRFERRGWAAPQRWPAIWRSIRWMREQAFDWVIDLQSLARS